MRTLFIALLLVANTANANVFCGFVYSISKNIMGTKNNNIPRRIAMDAATVDNVAITRYIRRIVFEAYEIDGYFDPVTFGLLKRRQCEKALRD